MKLISFGASDEEMSLLSGVAGPRPSGSPTLDLASRMRDASRDGTDPLYRPDVGELSPIAPLAIGAFIVLPLGLLAFNKKWRSSK
jgi:hypothetical protein